MAATSWPGQAEVLLLVDCVSWMSAIQVVASEHHPDTVTALMHNCHMVVHVMLLGISVVCIWLKA